MILVQKATTTTNVTLYNLKKDSSLSNPVWLFVFNMGGVDYPVILTDQSTATQREEFSLFNIVEGTDDPTNGEFILGGTGVYDVVIYEQTSTTNLDPDNATRVQETIARVIDTETSSYIEHIIDTSYIEHTITL